MELTGKCKEDFEASIEDIIKFNKLSNVSKNRKIIKWFESIGIKLTFYKSKLGGSTCYFSNEYCLMGWNYEDYLDKAIKKANEIYNQNK